MKGVESSVTSHLPQLEHSKWPKSDDSIAKQSHFWAFLGEIKNQCLQGLQSGQEFANADAITAYCGNETGSEAWLATLRDAASLAPSRP